MTERDYIELMLCRIEEMRKYQKAYFARKMESDKRMAIATELRVDTMILRLKGMGYDGSRFKDSTKQGALL